MNQHTFLDNLPWPDERRIALRVTPAAERAIRRGHPWLFDKAILHQSKDGKPGDLAVVFDRKRRFLAVGLYDPLSPIRVRVLQYGRSAPIDSDWFAARFQEAAKIRQPLALSSFTNGYRLVNGANDNLPGMVVDRYDQTYVLKLYTTAWIPHLPDVVPVLLDTTKARQLVLRLSRSVQAAHDYCCGLRDGMVLHGVLPDEHVVFQENGLFFEADVVRGQKTGFFLDQRDNRARLGQLVEPGQSVLNVFAYTGGFSLYAARAGASLVVSQDISQFALAGAVRNFKLNRHLSGVAQAEHELMLGDAFATLKELERTHRRFDVVVIDPPAFANSQDQVARALSAYGRLVRRGLRLLRPGGTFVMCSCSSRVSADAFFDMVQKAARTVKRPLQEIERTGHAIDHPVTFPEGAYLKALFAKG
jgi:23S rRNA (cytosine1962-C5)-methyltransferase